MNTNGQMTSGKIAKAAGVNVETLRFYEREGILAEPARTASGYRLYDESAVERIRFVQRAQALGFTLREVRELIALDARPDADCDDLRLRAENKLELVEQKMRELQRMKSALGTLLESCVAGQPVKNCPVMKCLTTCD